MSDIKIIEGGVTAAKGFKAGGIYSGIKNKTPYACMVQGEVLYAWLQADGGKGRDRMGNKGCKEDLPLLRPL